MAWKKLRRFVLVKKKSPSASVKARLSNLNNILKKYIIKEKFRVGVTGGRWRRRAKREMKQWAIFFVSTEQGKVKVLQTAIMVTLPLFLFFVLLPCSKSQEDFLDQHQKWNYREGGKRRWWWVSLGSLEFTNSRMKICLLCPWSEIHSAQSWVLFLDSWEAAEIFGDKNGLRNNQLGYLVGEENASNQRQRITLWGSYLLFNLDPAYF